MSPLFFVATRAIDLSASYSVQAFSSPIKFKRRDYHQQRVFHRKKPKTQAMIGKPSQSDVSVALQLKETKVIIASNAAKRYRLRLHDACQSQYTGNQSPREDRCGNRACPQRESGLRRDFQLSATQSNHWARAARGWAMRSICLVFDYMCYVCRVAVAG